MPGNPKGGTKGRDTVIAKYGPDFYKRIGAMGRGVKRTKPSGFAAMTPEKRREAGRKGGLARLSNLRKERNATT